MALLRPLPLLSFSLQPLLLPPLDESSLALALALGLAFGATTIAIGAGAPAGLLSTTFGAIASRDQLFAARHATHGPFLSF